MRFSRRAVAPRPWSGACGVALLLLLCGCGASPRVTFSTERRVSANAAPTDRDPVRVYGTVTFPDGSPAEDLAMVTHSPGREVWHEAARTDARGAYALDLPRGDVYTVAGWRTQPGERVVGAYADPRGDFASEAPCVRSFTFSRDGQAAVGTVSVYSWGAEAPYATVDASQPALVLLPCSAPSVRVSGSAGQTDPGDVPLPAPGDPVAVALEPVRTVDVKVRDAEGAPAAGRRVCGDFAVCTRTDLDGHAVVYAPATAPVTIVMIHTAEGVEAATGRVENPDGSLASALTDRAFTWTGGLNDASVVFQEEPVRKVELRCIGLDTAACVDVGAKCTQYAARLAEDPLAGRMLWTFPACSVTPGVWPPAWAGVDGVVGRVSCVCPVDHARLDAMGRVLTIPDSDDVVTLDFSGVPGSIVGRLPTARSCIVEATSQTAQSSLSWILGRRAVRRTARCDADGRFVVEHVEAGEWKLEVRVGRKVSQHVVAVADELVDLGEIPWPTEKRP